MQDKLFSLPVVTQISPYLTQRQIGELPAIVVSHPKVRAAITLQGAHLIAWQPSGEKPVLWLSDKSLFAPGKAIRGGVPICWPWFGPAKEQGLPAHGFARNLPWALQAHNEDESSVVLTFELQSSDASHQHWPHDFTLFARFKLAATCEMELEAHGEFETTSALHTYFNVGDIADVKVSGLGDRFIDKVNDAKEDVLTDGVQTFPDRTDRVYLHPEACNVIHDSALNRGIEVIHHHHSNVVGWNPGPALSVSMADVPDDGYKTFVCVETACVTTAQKASEEKPSRLGQTIRIVKR